jgi:hypothetical protein
MERNEPDALDSLRVVAMDHVLGMMKVRRYEVR